ncbi:hypothetical protein ANCDUO_06088 [Ancylostoma duodenale]|uniref:Uncharacterized protein n=1 Tax=Ancylostoma duodenale TaxID=51022 RepID=A0A0C2GX11_9BILA|nr:hypothetical protein ANCDUO_06088 [Ancylostoma duodenale]
MMASEAYTHIVRLLEAVNSCVSQVVQCMVLEDDSAEKIEELESALYFNPTKGMFGRNYRRNENGPIAELRAKTKDEK